jgi:nitrous oxide reductase accessory protein NosL
MSETREKSKVSKPTIFTVLVVILLAMGSAAYWFAESSANQTCGFCLRPLDPHLSVTAEIAGHKKHACCARCAITEANQQHKPVRLLEAHDYPTGKAIDPAKAFFVNDSRAIACTHDMPLMDQSKHSDHLAFDRCSPGAFTFEKRSDAEAFIQQNGGVLLSYTELIAQARYQ